MELYTHSSSNSDRHYSFNQSSRKNRRKAWRSCIKGSHNLIEQLRNKNKLPLLANATQEKQERLDYGKAVLE
jgi:hypothetical protein